MASVLIKNLDGSQREQEVGAQVSIGRAEGNDVVLLEGGVSRKHARLFQDEEGGWWLEDIGSANGTWVNGQEIRETTQLTSTDEVVIGDYALYIRPDEKVRPARRASRAEKRAARSAESLKASPSSSSMVKRTGPPKGTTPRLIGLSGVVEGMTFPLSGTVAIGRMDSMDIHIDDDSVSRQHAEVQVHGREVLLKDLGSANGTTINGAAIAEATVLAPGDIIQFGVVEMVFETKASSGGARVSGSQRAPLTGPPARDKRARSEHSGNGGLEPRKKRLIILGSAVAVFLLVLLAIKAITSPPLAQGSQQVKATRLPESQQDLTEQIETLIAECRTYSDTEHGVPNWNRALAACQKVLEMEPIHQEANVLMKRIGVLKGCQQNFDAAKAAIAGNQPEVALDSFAKIGKECEIYLLHSLSIAAEVTRVVKKRAGAECRSYATNRKWDRAYVSCELYTKLACQTMEPKDLYPPTLARVKLEGPLNPRTDWRPEDPLYLNFLKARAKVKPQEPNMWVCPELAALRPPPPPPDLGKLAKEELAARYPSAPELGGALVLYFTGAFPRALVPLSKVLDNPSKADVHEVAKALKNDINNAKELFENGTSRLTNDQPESAETPFRHALIVDERLVLGERVMGLSAEEKKRELEKRVSFLRRSIVENMGSKCYEKGKALADRKDFKGACRVWKLGQSFTESNIDLVKALALACTASAKKAFPHAKTCEQLNAVLDFAVDGDGYKEKVAAALTEQGCE